MANKEKHKKHKKEKSKKHKKEKKSKRHKKEKSRSETYSSNLSSSVDSGGEIKIKEEMKQYKLTQSEWGFLDSVLSDSNVLVKNKKVEKKRSRSPEPGQNIRELNPYWKDGGCGLPPNRSEEESRDLKPNTSRSFSNWSDLNSDNKKKSKPNFLKPGESSHFEGIKNLYQRNWKKKDDKFQESRDPESQTKPNDKNKQEASTSKTYTADDLNNLAAKLVKAEIMGNTALIDKLKAELEKARKAKEQGEPSQNQSEVVIVTGKGLKSSYDDKQSYMSSKKQKLNTHNSRERVFYFPDDDKYSLKNLFEKEKRGEADDELLFTKLKRKNPDELDDVYLEAAASQKYLEKSEERRKEKSKKEALVKHKTLDGCAWCLDNRNQTKHLIASTGTKCYLCLPEEESLSKGHCIIVPLQHEISTLHLDEDVWDEIKTYQRTLTKMFLEQEQDVVFFENARAFKHYPHCVIHCVPLDKEVGDLAPIYFQKAISESETEWSNNKKIIDFRNKELHRSIPKGLPYFAVSFGNEGGFAHLIEDELLFKKNFAEEVLGGMMDLDVRKWRKPQKENFRVQREKVLEFLKIWKKFEFNETFVDSASDSSSE